MGSLSGQPPCCPLVIVIWHLSWSGTGGAKQKVDEPQRRRRGGQADGAAVNGPGKADLLLQAARLAM